MAFSSGIAYISTKDEVDIVAKYLNINKIPCVIHSPLRKESHPSFGIYLSKNNKIRYIDFATGDKGNLYDLLSKLWNMSYMEVRMKLSKDSDKVTTKVRISESPKVKVKGYKDITKIEIKTREWKAHDIEYWRSYGIEISWLKYANVFPISHKFIIKGNKRYVFQADKYAYAYIERKEGKVSIKVYQPFNKKGFKWCTSTDSSVISLWTKVPPEGENICICSSLKDALCLWANTGIPSIATQGEGYTMSNTAINELKRRYKNIFILFDNDKSGLIDGKKLSKFTGFTNIVLPQFDGGKDISDFYKFLNNKEEFKKQMLSLFNFN